MATEWIWCMENPRSAAAEIDRLRTLLKEAIPFINDAGDDEDPEAQSRANDLFVRIAGALNGHQ